jgi:hypothetical protein
MIRSYFVILFLLSITISYGQVNKHGYPCGGMDILDVGIHIKGFKPQHQDEISADFLRKGFIVALTDTSYKLLRFVVSYSKDNKVTEYQIKGNVVSDKNANFLKRLQPGDFLSFECINIERAGFESLSTTMWIVVTN